MRNSRTLWQRCIDRNLTRKFVLVSLTVVTATVGFSNSDGFASALKPPKVRNTEKPSRKAAEERKAEERKAEERKTEERKTDEVDASKGRTVDKIARKTDDSDLKSKSVVQEIAENHPLKPLIKAAEESLEALKPVKDYSATLYKTEMVQGKIYEQKMFMKLRHEPFSVYLKFETLHEGREVIYVEGQNKGKLLAHETGFRALAGTLAYLPTAKEVLVDNRYPITQVGMRKLLEGMIDQWRDEGKYQEVTVETYSGASVGDTQCRMLEVIHPKAREHFKYHKSRLYLDAKSKFPIRLEQYVWPQKEGDEPVLVEEYIYTDIKINSGFTDADFDKNNKAYAY